ncbi:LLM class flavin-dependent oxidoreductase [Nonomuraea sp. NPDC050404]|uniref:LLM class flavin-dependent oxidoreductase n=1 Tax=Nonomuraea sp. NPDC050404 TaxID=3155783 RepID=UPI0033CB4DC9
MNQSPTLPIQILGMVSTTYGSESAGWRGPVVDPGYLADFARAHEEAGFDRALVAHSASSPEGFAAAAHVLYNTERLRVLIAQRPGFIQPTLTARKLATLDNLTGAGRVAIHHITGGSDTDQRRDGDFENKAARYRRTAEFIDVLRRTLTSDEPFDHEGEFYRFEGAFSSVKPHGPVPIFFGGQSDDAIRVGGRWADVYALWGEPLAQTRERVELIRAEAARHGRQIEFSLSVRPIVAETEDAAWEKADAIRRAFENDLAQGGAGKWRIGRGENTAVGAKRLKEEAEQKLVHDERLWFGVTRLTDGGGNSTALVGTPRQVADALLKYYDLGIGTFLIRGFDPLRDVREWGKELVPLLRAGATARARALIGAGQ